MRVLIATPLYPPEVGGPATHTRLLEDGLPKLGIEVEVLPFSTVRRYPPIIRHLLYMWKILVRAEQADVIFSQDMVSCGLPALVAAKLRGRPLVVRVPGDYAWEQARERLKTPDSVETFQNKKYTRGIERLRRLERFVIRHATHVVTPSDFTARIVTSWQPKALTVIPNGVLPPKQITPPKAAPPSPLIVTASRLIRGKGFEELIALLKDLPEWHLAIIGEGPLEGALRTHVRASGVGGRVLFLGPQTQEELFGYMQSATVFVLNTEFESFSFLIIEALQAGVPVVSTQVGAIPDILESGKEGMLVKAHDTLALKEAIESTRVDKVLWAARVEAGRRKAALFSNERMTASFASLFKKLCQ